MSNDKSPSLETPVDRRFRWISSLQCEPALLDDLEKRMERFYSEPSTRDRYQAMVDSPEASQPATEAALRRAILRQAPSSLLEIGCGSGRIYRRLVSEGLSGRYTGLEMAPQVIAENLAAFPDATWVTGSIASAPFGPGSFDVAYAFFVLEHCVRPEPALARLLSWVRPGGHLLLVFPDFPKMGRLASQRLGLRLGNARHLLKQGHPFHALFNLYESRIRLPRALNRLAAHPGPFPVNTAPACLVHDGPFTADLDAIYISSASEVASWAAARGCRVNYPEGQSGNFSVNVLIQITQPG